MVSEFRGYALVSLAIALALPASLSAQTGGYAAGGSDAPVSGGTTAPGERSTAIGGGDSANATAEGNETVAIGKASLARMERDVAIGANAVADGDIPDPGFPFYGNATALGFVSKAKGYGATALGGAQVHGRYSVGIGGSHVGGPAANEESRQSIAIGAAARAGASLINPAIQRSNSIAIGAGTTAVFDAIALGGGSYAFGDHSVAIGIAARTGTGDVPVGAQVEGPSAIAIGSLARARNDSTIAIGPNAKSEMQSALSLGQSASATADYAIAMGSLAKALAPYSVGIGYNSEIPLANSYSTALGASTEIGGQAFDVALGFRSKTAPKVAVPSVTLNGTSFGFAGGTPTSTVSIGSAEETRTVTNVAAGRVSDTSTDAVNGSQLYAALNFIANLRSGLAALIGGGLVIGADGTVQVAPTITVGGNACTTLTEAVMATC